MIRASRRGPGDTHLVALALALCMPLLALACSDTVEIDFDGPTAEWREYGGDKGGSRSSPLTQITPDNVSQLEVAWIHHTGDVDAGEQTKIGTSFQATPILVQDKLYVCTPRNRVIALDPATGERLWLFDPEVDTSGIYIVTCRGVSYGVDAQVEPGGACRERIFMGTIDARLIAIDALDGRPCESFGQGGSVDLGEGVGGRYPGEYGVTSPPAVLGDVVVTGTMVLDNIRIDAPGGVVRGYDLHSGALRWSWDPMPPGRRFVEVVREDGERVRYHRGTTNAWSVLSADVERNLVFVPTGNTSPDYFGGERNGLDYYSSSVVALDASTGEVVWHFQTVHHDIWDYDVPAQPVLYRHVPQEQEDEAPGTDERGAVPALAQATKMGHVFLLDRETGEPIFPVEERPVPRGGVEGEVVHATQPFPTRPAPIHPATLTPDEAWGLTPWDRGRCRDAIAALDSKGIFTPPSTRGFVQYPSYFGGSNWGSVAVEPNRRILVANTSRVPGVLRMIPRAEYEAEQARLGAPPPGIEPQQGTPYAMTRSFLLSPLGLPCSPPPWGTLVGIDLDTGDRLWEVPLGSTRDLAPVPIALDWGVPNQGGPIVTASGLVFIAATMDDYLRAFDVETGAELWKGRLPAGGQATPMTYRVGRDDRQYVVVAAGGHSLMGTKLGDTVVAFALPEGGD
jgi:quinoprotein glucose dehydrogenase